MIGVIANPSEHAVVCEFFELFKTPWEFFREGEQYDVLFCAGEAQIHQAAAQLMVIYAGRELLCDKEAGLRTVSCPKNPLMASYGGLQLPLYCGAVTFLANGSSELIDPESKRPMMCSVVSDGSKVIRIGYDLVAEVRSLLTEGQPASNAHVPALDLHIALLRDLIVENGSPLMEIPPVPDGYQCIACLTHDVDHPLVRRHKGDHTMFGFLFRAVFGSLRDFFRGRMPFRNLVKNWFAALRLPLVYLGWAEDFWSHFDDYTKIEAGLPSSFFVIPFAGNRGSTAMGPAPAKRAAAYGAADIAAQIRKLCSAGFEIGLHGIDAWCDSSKGTQEFNELRRVTEKRHIGVRMHWLYFDQQSPRLLEHAGAEFDSTVGYNQTIGYRAGTTQVYKPLGTAHLLELPLHIMDTALFYPDYLHLSAKEAEKETRPIIRHAVQFGGVVTVNWHDRSIAPERLWTDSYIHLIDELKKGGAWFATASQAVSWFRTRRSATFVDGDWRWQQPGAGVPGLQTQIYNAANLHNNRRHTVTPDLPLANSALSA